MWPFKKKDQPKDQPKEVATVKKSILRIYTHEAKIFLELTCEGIDGFKNFMEWYEDKNGDEQFLFCNENGRTWGVSKSAIGGFFHDIIEEPLTEN